MTKIETLLRAADGEITPSPQAYERLHSALTTPAALLRAADATVEPGEALRTRIHQSLTAGHAGRRNTRVMVAAASVALVAALAGIVSLAMFGQSETVTTGHRVRRLTTITPAPQTVTATVTPAPTTVTITPEAKPEPPAEPPAEPSGGPTAPPPAVVPGALAPEPKPRVVTVRPSPAVISSVVTPSPYPTVVEAVRTDSRTVPRRSALQGAAVAAAAMIAAAAVAFVAFRRRDSHRGAKGKS